MKMRARTNLISWLATSVFLLLMVSTATGEIIFVDADANGANDGTSWADTHKCLQDALVSLQRRKERMVE